MPPWMVAAVAAVVLAAGACGQAATNAGPPAEEPAVASAMGPGLSIADAQASDLQGALLVNGYLYAREGEPVRLCSMFAESFPPQCAGETLEVEGVDLAVYELTSEGAVRWSEQPVQLLGTVAGGTITVSSTASA
jgi:hypothetical protein